jgi:hypothetical protein
MIRVRPTQAKFRRCQLFTIPFLLPLVCPLTPGELIANAELPLGFTPSHDQPLSAPSAIAFPTRDWPITQTEVPTRSISAIDGFESYAIMMTAISHQDPALGMLPCE